jgi:hypothetical protein
MGNFIRGWNVRHLSLSKQVTLSRLLSMRPEETDLRSGTSQLLKTMAQQLSEFKADAAAARAAADAAIAVQAKQAAQVSRSKAIKSRAPPSYENKEKDLPIQK